MTNIVLLSLAIVTNQQQAIVGQTNGQALLVTHETVSQRVELGYERRQEPESRRAGVSANSPSRRLTVAPSHRLISLGDFTKVLSSRFTTSTVPIIFSPPPPAPGPMPGETNAARRLPPRHQRSPVEESKVQSPKESNAPPEELKR